MSKAIKTIGVVAGAVALVATGVGAFAVAGAGIAGVGTFSAIGAVAGVVSGIASLGAQAFTKPPSVRGSVTQIVIDPDAAQPYCMGEGYFAGRLRQDTGYGATLKDVPNPYRFFPVVYSGGGPVESITPQFEFGAMPSWYNGFLYTDTQLGACPEADALSPQWAGAPGWTAASKLSGQAAIGWSALFDKEGKRFAGMDPRSASGAYGRWVKVYDPRKDSTQPGGSGAHRLGDETTYEYSANPALHAGTYAFGRYQNGKRTMGMGLPADGIDWAVVAAWANTCTANGWENFFGVVFEPGDRWANLKDICFAGGAEPVPGGKLTFKYSAPVVALDTVTIEDLTDDKRSIVGMQPFRDRINTAVPKYRSPAHNWEMVDAEPVVNATFLAEDGEEKREVWPFNFVKDETQAAELAAYRMFDSRELTFSIVCKPHMRHYRPGECLHVTDHELGLDITAIILRRQIDPTTMKVTFEMMTEAAAKHAYCLGQTGVAPPTPAIGQTAQERDEVASGSNEPLAYASSLIAISYTTDADPLDGLLQATDAEITVEDHTRTYSDKTVSVTGDSLTQDAQGNALTDNTLYHVYYDDQARAGGGVALKATTSSQTAANSSTNPYRHYVGSIRTDVVGGTGTSGGGSVPPGWSGDDFQQ